MVKKQSVLVTVVIVFCIVGTLYVWKKASFWSFTRSNTNHNSHSHSHGDLDPVSAQHPYPTLDVRLQREGEDPILFLETKNFSFRSTEDTNVRGPNVGHAHLFVDGEAIAMFYADRYVLPNFMPGFYELKVTLNEARSHAPMKIGEKIISDTIELHVRKKGS